MPSVIGHTPPWLSRPSPGFDVFAASQSKSSSALAGEAENNETPLRVTAVRGTEVFHALGNEIRWTDLSVLREQWAERHGRHTEGGLVGAVSDRGDSVEETFRLLKVPVSRKIERLVVSPNELFLAIVTSHTVHIAVLPHLSYLSSTDTTPLKLRTFQIGPTTHVVERSKIAAVIWHPLGQDGSCLITVTRDSVVRLWELDRNNRWSFDMPTLAVDLKKLANGLSTADDFSPSKYGISKGFSPDSFEMEVASACFGASGIEVCTSWAPMTLWVAMKQGDIYALCPLLPTRWQAPESFLTALSSTVNLICSGKKSSDGDWQMEDRVMDQQKLWMSNLQRELSDGPSHHDVNTPRIYQRPASPSAVSKLQGPFRLSPDPDLILDISDIHVLFTSGDGLSANTSEALSTEHSSSDRMDLVLLATSDGIVYVSLSVTEVEPKWLPLKQASTSLDSDTHPDVVELLVFESISLSRTNNSSLPAFTRDNSSASSILVTHSAGVSRIDCSSLADKLGEELNSETESGTEFRINMLAENSRSSCECLIDFSRSSDSSDRGMVTACASVIDPDYGQVIVATASGQPLAVTIETAEIPIDILNDQELIVGHLTSSINELAFDDTRAMQAVNTARPPYQPHPAFWTASTVPKFLEEHVHSRNLRSMSEEIRLSPSTLKLLMEAHRILSLETHRLGLAAADLFSRCERLQDEFREQLHRAREVAERVDAISGDDADVYEYGDEVGLQAGAKGQVEARLDKVRSRQEELTLRHEAFRNKLVKLNGRPFGEKERAWATEVRSLGSLVLQALPENLSAGDRNDESGGQAGDREVEEEEADVSGQRRQEPWHRLSEAKALQEELMVQVREQGARAASKPDGGASGETQSTHANTGFNVAQDRRRARSSEIDELLYRQTALVEATREKLSRLQGMATA